jgi:hypothetical protein
MFLGQVNTTDRKAGYLIKYSKLYCLSFSVLMLYPFLPKELMDLYVTPLLLGYNMFWLLLLSGLLLYAFIPDRYIKRPNAG